MSRSQEYSRDLLPTVLKEALASFSKETEGVLKSFFAPMEASEPPQTIYHYTNDEGLRGILETRKLWLTDIFNLNDPSELRHGFSIASGILKNRVAEGPGETREFARLFENFGKRGGLLDSGNYFMCSFSSVGDDLGQWRAYADNGRGYALAFNAKFLESEFVNQSGYDLDDSGGAAQPQQASGLTHHFLKTFPITYNDAKLAEIHNDIIDNVINLISLPQGKGLARPALVTYMAELATVLVVRVVLACLHFKHEAYRNEEEYRFLEVRSKMARHEAKVRARPYSLVRYTEFEWKKGPTGPLEKIVVGPAADRSKAMQFAQDCLRAFYSEPVEVVCSDIPYRAG